MERYAVLDIGTNSIKLHVAEKNFDGQWKSVWDSAKITRLGEGLQAAGKLGINAMERTIAVMSEMKTLAHTHGVQEIVAAGTMCLRTASNAADFIRRVQEQCGITVEVLSGEEEARLAYLAVQSGLSLDRGALMIFDTGGGSTEFIFGRNNALERRFSVNVGAVRLTEEILLSDPVSTAEVDRTVAAIAEDLAGFELNGTVDRIVGIGGTVTTLSGVKQRLSEYRPDRIQGSMVELSEIERQIDMYAAKTIAERQAIIGLHPQRADVILAGALIVREILKKARVESLTVSGRGMRHGLLVDRCA
ncbi:phosphatase [candidate division KSB3 bacterium]|uniref:Phosphatase n=1 Tax=candidate division KSB3 bacterium TaxID=2044937 RepID=A0A2G6E3B0_9BACT|nr:MAG: phosphatase [candidate division KSB3 bacterium]PIE28915.1 MAG: phosphatase [candidate division KSB3 bacterium]